MYVCVCVCVCVCVYLVMSVCLSVCLYACIPIDYLTNRPATLPRTKLQAIKTLTRRAQLFQLRLSDETRHLECVLQGEKKYNSDFIKLNAHKKTKKQNT